MRSRNRVSVTLVHHSNVLQYQHVFEYFLTAITIAKPPFGFCFDGLAMHDTCASSHVSLECLDGISH